jgi:SPP1 gp7 family putative phage head morphogenesis protein
MAGRDLNSNIDAIDKQLAYIQDKAQREIAANYVYALKDIQDEVSTLYAKYAEDGKLTNAELTKYNRLKGLYQTITTTLKGMFVDVSKVNGMMIKDITEESFFKHAWAIEQTAGVSLKWGLLNPQIVDAAVNNELRYLAEKEVAERTLTQVRRTIAQGIIRGQSYAKMAKALAGTMNKSASGYVRIAQTEGARAQVLGQKASYEQAMEEGVEVEQVWLATLDDKTRDSHRGMDGEVAVNNGSEEEPDWEWNMPGKGWVKGPLLTGYPEEDINCRCTVRPQIKGYEPKVRAARDEGIIEYQTYREWVGRKGEPGTVSDRSAETVRTAG